MRAVVWSDYARTQYLAALAYLTERNETAAEHLLERVEKTVDDLARRPIGRPGYAADTFEKVILRTSYLLVYELAGDELRVLRLFHMSQDWRSWRNDEEAPQ